jgi:hypothetical protein
LFAEFYFFFYCGTLIATFDITVMRTKKQTSLQINTLAQVLVVFMYLVQAQLRCFLLLDCLPVGRE